MPQCKDPLKEKERLIKISNANRGRRHTEATKNKIRNSHYGMGHTEETKRKLSEWRTGRFCGSNSYMFGKPKSEEHKKLISELAIARNQGGDRNPNWRGGSTSLIGLIRSCNKMALWRNEVFRRDNYRDWFSGGVGNHNLEAHHHVPISRIIKKYQIKTLDDALECKEMWDINNGVTMFKTSHVFYHAIWGIN